MDDGDCYTAAEARKCNAAIREVQKLRGIASDQEAELNGVRGEVNECRSQRSAAERRLERALKAEAEAKAEAGMWYRSPLFWASVTVVVGGVGAIGWLR